MINWLRWIRTWFAKRSPKVPAVSPAPTGHNRPPATPGNYSGQAFYKFEHLLDDLESYFEMIQHMRRTDLSTYQLYRRIGAQLVSETVAFEGHRLPSEWRDGPRMANGMVHFPKTIEHKKGFLPNTFMAFSKKKHVNGITPPPGGSIYAVSLYWYEEKKARILAAEYHVAVDAQCKVTPFKRHHVTFVELPPKHKGSYRRPAHFGKPTWDYGLLEDLLEDNKKDSPELQPMSIEDYARHLFCLAVNICYASSDGLQIRVRKDNVVARFNIALLRTPYFFKERDKTVTVNGLTKPIFHIVRAHRRITAGGNVRYVRSHFRGERHFTWKGYHVGVTMPGWHHRRIEEMDLAAETIPADAKTPPGWVGPDWLGNLLSRHYEGRKQRKAYRDQ